jgi:hypothetical protein
MNAGTRIPAGQPMTATGQRSRLVWAAFFGALFGAFVTVVLIALTKRG